MSCALPMPFVDIHCHLLPGLDDGASDWDEAIAMAEMAVADGIATVVATPHQLGSHAKNSGSAIREAAARFQESLERRRLPLRVLPGADVRIEPDLPAKVREGKVLTLADRQRHLLLELPHNVYLPLDRLLAELAASHIVGILSHPERNQGILAQPHLVGGLVNQGCLMQITAGSLLGAFGPSSQRLAERLIEQRCVHFVSTDAHGTKTRPPQLRTAFDRVVKLAGQETAFDLFCRNPEAVARGANVASTRRESKKSVRTGWFRWTFSSEPVGAGPI